MKRMKIMVAAIALCGLAACSDNTPKSFTGTITDASMNTVTVENAEGTFTFSTMDADKSEANGLLLGAPVTVNYSGKLEEGAAASKVATLRYASWELQGEAGKILLKGVSEGSGSPIEFTETATIAKDADGIYTLTIEGNGAVYTKANE